MESATQSFGFQADVAQVLKLVVNSLYSNREIFLRELVSNASDAIDKLRFRAIEDKSLLEAETPSIRIHTSKETKTLTIEDDGVGMSKEELVKNLGTIAHSGTQHFLKVIEERGGKPDLSLIGQFGVGFYSAFLVADKVDVISRAAGSTEVWRWTSEAKESFEVAPAERAGHGTTLVLHLKADALEYTSEWSVKDLVQKYSDFVSHPIEVLVPGYQDEPPKYERANSAQALWKRSKSEIKEEQYTEFYKHLTSDWEPPLAHSHFKVEGTQEFAGILFVPKRAPFDLFQRDHRRGVRLHVKRVFIMDDAKDLVPEWLRFVRGVVDSEDLPLNVSRELLQDSRIAQTIRKQVVKKTLDLLDEMAKDKAEDYASFWKLFGSVLKEGLHYEPENKTRLASLLRYGSNKLADGEATSLSDYKSRMPEGQPAIYYLTGESRRALDGSPFLETLSRRGYEVLLMTDAVDEWAIEALREFDGTPLVSAVSADLKIEQTDEEKAAQEEKSGALSGLLGAFKTILDDKVSEVRVSSRLTDSPICLVVPTGGLSAYMERLLKAHERNVPDTKRILEVNPDHGLVRSLRSLHEKDPGSAQLVDFVEVLYDQALITEGSPVADPQRFARRMTKLLESAAG